MNVVSNVIPEPPSAVPPCQPSLGNLVWLLYGGQQRALLSYSVTLLSLLLPYSVTLTLPPSTIYAISPAVCQLAFSM